MFTLPISFIDGALDIRPDNTVKFNGSSDYLSVGHSPSLDITGNITLSAWVNLSSLGSNQIIISKYNPSSSDRSFELFYKSTGSFILAISGNGTTVSTVSTSAVTPVVNTWYHVCAQYDGVNIKLYINGVEDGSTAYSSGIHSSTVSYTIGVEGDNSLSAYMNGNISNVMVFNDTVNVSELYGSSYAPRFEDLNESTKAKCVISIPLRQSNPAPYSDQTINNNNSSILGTPTLTTPVINTLFESTSPVPYSAWSDKFTKTGSLIDSVGADWGDDSLVQSTTDNKPTDGGGFIQLDTPEPIIGSEWEIQSTPADVLWTSVRYGAGRWVAISATEDASTSVMISEDNGVTWELLDTPIPTANSWYGLEFANNQFVSCARTGSLDRIMTSPDGLTWTTRATPNNGQYHNVTYGNGTWVAVSSSNATKKGIYSTDNAVTWYETDTADNGSLWSGLTFANGKFVAVSRSGIAQHSTDGITWTQSTSIPSKVWYEVTHGLGLYVAVGLNGAIATSVDADTWTLRPSPNSNDLREVIFAGDKFIACSTDGVGNRVMTSEDGLTWDEENTAADNEWWGLGYANGKLVAVASTGTGNRVMISPPNPHHFLNYTNTIGTINDFTLFMEINAPATGNADGVLFEYDDVSNGGLMVKRSAAGTDLILSIDGDNAGFVDTLSSPFMDNTIHKIAFRVKSDNTTDIFLDGRLDSSGTWNGSNLVIDPNIYIGGEAIHFGTCDIYNIKLFTHQVTDTQLIEMTT